LRPTGGRPPTRILGPIGPARPAGEDRAIDLVVIGGGMGGPATAALAQRRGLRTALLEAHTKLGGCAGYFARGPYTFDVGAMALMGLRDGEPIGDLRALTVPGQGTMATVLSAIRVVERITGRSWSSIRERAATAGRDRVPPRLLPKYS
jgi:hypothetical protein